MPSWMRYFSGLAFAGFSAGVIAIGLRGLVPDPLIVVIAIVVSVGIAACLRARATGGSHAEP